ncbi:hypothetical protein ACYT85_24225 [Ralstonia solanacearum]|uniref:hypothetical protein n=1 Tax=Ralstonia solanacearum TaxID=305 RepID=UPI002E23CAFF
MIPATRIADFLLKWRSDAGDIERLLIWRDIENIEQARYVAVRLPWRISILVVVRSIEEEAQTEFPGALTHDCFHVAGHAACLFI